MTTPVITPATLTQEQAAEYIGISHDLLHRMVRPDLRPRGQKPLPAPPRCIRISNRVLYRPADLDAWLERQALGIADISEKKPRGRPRKTEHVAA